MQQVWDFCDKLVNEHALEFLEVSFPRRIPRDVSGSYHVASRTMARIVLPPQGLNNAAYRTASRLWNLKDTDETDVRNQQT